MTKEEVINQVIWEEIMEGTAHAGWTDKARANLVKLVQYNVQWASSLTDVELKEYNEIREFYSKKSEE